MAASTSESSVSGTVPISCPLAGLTTSILLLPPSTNFPLMKLRQVMGELFMEELSG
jgi:hypothetical protein